MGRKSIFSTNTFIKSMLHRMFLRSRERVLRLKQDGYCCQVCGAKQSRRKGAEVKVNCHHLNGVRWKVMIAYIRKELLVTPDKLTTLCVTCHKSEHEED